MTFYSSVIIMTELMMIAMSLHVLHYSGFKKVQKGWYLATFISIMLCAAAEFAVHCGYYSPKYKIPLTVITVLQFSISPLLGVLFTGALGLTKQAKFAIFFVSASAVAEIISAPFGFIFYFDQSGYQRGKYFFIYGIFYFVSLLYLIVCMVVVGKKFRHRDAITIIMILVILVAGILPMTVYKLNITYIAVALSASLCYIYYNDLVQQDIQAELVLNQKKLTSMQGHIISSLASLIESRDTETGDHVSRTGAFVEALARDAIKDGVYTDTLNERFVAMLRTLAPMHDIGKIVVSDRILRKPSRLTEEEFEQMKKHASAGGTVIRDVLSGVADEEYLSLAADIATFHHEKWNGMGYPAGLSGENIPLSARIMAIADVFDALISERCYKKPIPIDEAMKIIEEDSGKHFDPKLVAVFLRHRDDFYKLGTAEIKSLHNF
ncbi:MAG: HD domain-containing protein [Clostridia bacterium]|nr:HD domain-containing protein [Clostridia bacterium]